MLTLPLTRKGYEAVERGKKTSCTMLLRIPHKASNHLVEQVTRSGRTFIAYENGIPCPVRPAYEPNQLVGICEPVVHDAELGRVYVWDYDDGECPCNVVTYLQWMKPRDARLLIMVESVRAMRLSDITEEMALAEGVWLNDNGLYSFEHRAGVVSAQPTAAGAFVEAFVKGYKLSLKNHWVWNYTFKLVKNLKHTEHETEIWTGDEATRFELDAHIGLLV